MTCLVSGGADSTCLWLVLRDLGYAVSAVHMNHKRRGEESEEDARFCAETLGAEVVELDGNGLTEAQLREQRYQVTSCHKLRATGHTASDQVATILYRLVSRGAATGIQPRNDLGVVHPLLPLWREETEAYCRAGRARVPRRLVEPRHAARPDPRRDPAAAAPAASGGRREPPPRARLARDAAARARRASCLAGRLEARRSRRRRAGGARARAPLARARPRRDRRRGALGRLVIRSELPGLRVRGWRPGDRLAGRSRKIQDVFVDAKVPRSEREAWPLVVRGDEVVAVPGIVEHRRSRSCPRLSSRRRSARS